MSKIGDRVSNLLPPASGSGPGNSAPTILPNGLGVGIGDGGGQSLSSGSSTEECLGYSGSGSGSVGGLNENFTGSTLECWNCELESLEDQVLATILEQLRQEQHSQTRESCDAIFGSYTHAIVLPYANFAMASRAIHFARTRLIPAVLQIEAEMAPSQFHKGALFYDTALAYLVAGDDDNFEYFLAMGDEENHRTLGTARGQISLKDDSLTSPTIAPTISFFADLLNGATGSFVTYEFAFGAPVTVDHLNIWRGTLEPMHHFEFLRILREAQVFSMQIANYVSVLDNPYIMLRLAKLVAHAAQWVESDLTHLQSGRYGMILSLKLQGDPDFTNLHTAAGLPEAEGKKNMAGSPPHGSDMNATLRTLLSDLKIAKAYEQKHWRMLRVLYIARNATAHTIDSTFQIYTDRDFLLEILQTVFMSVFVIRRSKAAATP